MDVGELVAHLQVDDRQADRTLDELDNRTVDPQVDLDIARAQAKKRQLETELDELRRRKADPQVDLDIAEAEAKKAKLEKELAELGQKKSSPEVDLKIAQAQAALGRVNTQLDELGRKKANPQVDLDIAKAEAELRALEAKLSALGRRTYTPRVRVDTDSGRGGGLSSLSAALGAMFKAGSALPSLLGSISGAIAGLFSSSSSGAEGMSGMSSAAMGLGRVAGGAAAGVVGLAAAVIKASVSWLQFGAQASAVLGIIGAVTFAVGAVGSAVSALPALLFGAAAAGGAVALGFDGIKRAASVAKPALDQLKTAIAGVFQRELTPMFRDIAKILPQLRTGFEGVAVSVSNFVKQLAGVFTSVEGVRRLQVVLSNTRVLIDAMAPGVTRLMASLLEAAQVTGAFRLLGEIIGVVASRVGELFARFAQGGESSLMVRSLEQLRNVLDAALQAFNGLIIGATEFFTAAGPGVVNVFNAIRDTLAEIDFASLGRSFGTFAAACATFIQSIPPSTWQALSQAVGDLANAFRLLASDPNIIGLFNALVMTVPLAVTAFANLLTAIQDVIGAAVTMGETFYNLGVSIGTNTQLGMTAAAAAVTTGWASIQAATSLGVTLFRTTFTTGFNSLGTIVQMGMTAAGAAVRVGWSQISAASSLGVSLMRTAVSVGFSSLGGIVSVGMSTIGVGVRAGWAAATAAARAGIATMRAAVSVGFNTVTSTVRQAMSAAGTAIRAGWNTATAAFRIGVSTVVAAVRAMPGQIRAALGNLGSLLTSAGRALMDGLLAGIRAGAQAVYNFVSGIAARIRALKGPIGYDKRVLTDNGLALMAGLHRGISSGLTPVLRDVATYAGQVAAQVLGQGPMFRQAGMTLGQQLRAGLAAGMAQQFSNLPNVVRLGSVSDATWDRLRAAGWRGRAGDGMEALYRPAGGGGGQISPAQLEAAMSRALATVPLLNARDLATATRRVNTQDVRRQGGLYQGGLPR